MRTWLLRRERRFEPCFKQKTTEKMYMLCPLRLLTTCHFTILQFIAPQNEAE